MATNWNLLSNGATASATSTYASSHAASYAIAGTRVPSSAWNTGGIYHSADEPATLTVTYPSAKPITEFVVVGVRNSFTDLTAVERLTETATSYGLVNFTIEAKISGTWTLVATITGNNRLMRRIPIAPVTATETRIIVTSGHGAARIAAFEAWNAPSPAGKYSQVCFFGNSITNSPASYGLWYDFGMAASIREHDYVHRLVNALTSSGGVVGFSQNYNAIWEQNFTTYDKSNFNGQFTTEPDLVVVRLGENVTYSASYPAAFLALLDYIRTQAPAAQIIVSGSYWTGHESATAAQAAGAAARGLLCIPLSHLDISANQANIGDVITDNSGGTHTITDGGVARHPNDAGMSAIANEIYRGLYPLASYTPDGGINVGGGSAAGIYAAETSSNFSGGSTATQARTYDTGLIVSPPPDAALNAVRYGAGFSEIVTGLTAGQTYHFRIFSAWAEGAHSFTVKANSALKGELIHAAGFPGLVVAFECDAVANGSGNVTLLFEVTNVFALVNAIDWKQLRAPTANFTKSAASGYAPLTVNFTDTSADSPTEWLWSFGDGTTSAARSPSNTYTTPGTYTVILTASNALGSDASDSQSITVTVAPGTGRIYPV